MGRVVGVGNIPTTFIQLTVDGSIIFLWGKREAAALFYKKWKSKKNVRISFMI